MYSFTKHDTAGGETELHSGDGFLLCYQDAELGISVKSKKKKKNPPENKKKMIVFLFIFFHFHIIKNYM